MCWKQWITSPACALKHDPGLSHPRLRTESEGFFQHGFFQKRTAGCQRSQRCRAHCSDADTVTPTYAQVLASAQAGDQKFFAWDPQAHWRRSAEGARVLDERCERCRRRENARAR